MLGVVGGLYLSKMSYAWFSFEMNVGSCLQGYCENGKYKTKLTRWGKYGNEVVAVDGMWLFIRRSLFDDGQIAWDVDTYSDFHFYDMDISMQVLKSGHTIAIADILVEHRSNGNFNKAFWKSNITFHEKWNDFLPVGNINISEELVRLSELRMYNAVIIMLLDYKDLLDRSHFWRFYNIYTWIKRLGSYIAKPFAKVATYGSS